MASPLHNRQNISSVNPTETYNCNGTPYVPLNYTCYDRQLCPVVNSRRQEACGEACYDPALYGCTNKTLVQIHASTFSNGTSVNITAVPTSVYPSTLTVSGGPSPSASGASSALATAASASVATSSFSSVLGGISATASSLGAAATTST
ncbi:carbohydrate-binding module family 52 protein [Glonium stellatum]|uniref:Carbohydrate-binding module family 52 protein n=1 Tax=Glonium stellatum TaxID=574774 RepID=A0A8E2JVD2_9PEZI|nr:carbohydrate-binding module family 52 protein [Glonium stellatum]